MNERIRELAESAKHAVEKEGILLELVLKQFAELIVRECRTVVNELYHKTPLELCGPLLTADEEIAKHFGVEE